MPKTPAQTAAYEAYIAAGKALYAVVAPTDEELTAAIQEASDAPDEIVEEYFCIPKGSGDKGFTAAYIYEMREIAEEEDEPEPVDTEERYIHED